MNKNSLNIGCGCILWFIIFIVTINLIILKLVDLLDYSWLEVTSPIWGFCLFNFILNIIKGFLDRDIWN